ncbi:MAG: hypothetical protein R2732_07135 [Microbacteriaceae bacterium]|jgi:hypothetical protein|nr:hypothetical protein [Microbacteriaceae bacterium]HPZ35500.1 hypothetical protein [Microbacteriaceae bacterium]HQC93445.1 hypothetical protein [Microbacteriaceae bacterium]
MAVFGARPEEPTEWAGLPAEPLEEDDFALLPPGTAAATADALFGIAPSESIAISLSAIPAEPEDAGASDDAPADDARAGDE